MTVTELNRNQLEQLKVDYYDTCLQETFGQSISMSEICMIDKIVTDEEIFESFSDTEFVEEDFV